MVDVSKLPVSYLQILLLTNPDATSFSFGADVSRSVVQNIVDTKPLPVTVHPVPSRPIVGLKAIGGSNKNKD